MHGFGFHERCLIVFVGTNASTIMSFGNLPTGNNSLLDLCELKLETKLLLISNSLENLFRKKKKKKTSREKFGY